MFYYYFAIFIVLRRARCGFGHKISWHLEESAPLFRSDRPAGQSGSVGLDLIRVEEKNEPVLRATVARVCRMAHSCASGIGPGDRGALASEFGCESAGEEGRGASPVSRAGRTRNRRATPSAIASPRSARRQAARKGTRKREEKRPRHVADEMPSYRGVSLMSW